MEIEWQDVTPAFSSATFDFEQNQEDDAMTQEPPPPPFSLLSRPLCGDAAHAAVTVTESEVPVIEEEEDDTYAFPNVPSAITATSMPAFSLFKTPVPKSIQEEWTAVQQRWPWLNHERVIPGPPARYELTGMNPVNRLHMMVIAEETGRTFDNHPMFKWQLATRALRWDLEGQNGPRYLLFAGTNGRLWPTHLPNLSVSQALELTLIPDKQILKTFQHVVRVMAETMALQIEQEDDTLLQHDMPRMVAAHQSLQRVSSPVCFFPAFPFS